MFEPAQIIETCKVVSKLPVKQKYLYFIEIFMGVLKHVILYEEISFKCLNNDKSIVIE